MRLPILFTVAALAVSTPVLAQNDAAGQPGAGTTPPEQTQPSPVTPVPAPHGTTSGPAAGTPTTMGTGGKTTATKHMRRTLRHHRGSSMTHEQQGQAGGAAGQPGESDAGSGTHSPATAPK